MSLSKFQVRVTDKKVEFESKEEDWLAEGMNSLQKMEQDSFRQFLDFAYLYHTALTHKSLWILIPYFGIILGNTFKELNVNLAIFCCKALVWFSFLQGVICCVFKGMEIKPGSMGKAVPLYDVQVCWLLFRVFHRELLVGWFSVFVFLCWTKICVVFHSRS